MEGNLKRVIITYPALRAVSQKSLHLSTCTYDALHLLGQIGETKNLRPKQSGRGIPFLL